MRYKMTVIIITFMMLAIVSLNNAYPQTISLYGGLPFSPEPLELTKGKALSNPLTIRILATNEKGKLVPEKDSGVPVRESFDPRTGKLTSELYTHAANVTWEFTKAGIEFIDRGITYRVQKEGATITFTETGIKMLGIERINRSIVSQTQENIKGRELVKPAAGEYRAKLDDGSIFDLTLVSREGILFIEKVGYRFAASKFLVRGLTTQDKQPFGKSTATGLEFQFPLLLELGFSGAKVTYYRGDLKWATLDTVVCTLRKIDAPAKDLVDLSNFGRAVEVGSATDATELKDSYEFLLKKEDTSAPIDEKGQALVFPRITAEAGDGSKVKITLKAGDSASVEIYEITGSGSAKRTFTQKAPEGVKTFVVTGATAIIQMKHETMGMIPLNIGGEFLVDERLKMVDDGNWDGKKEGAIHTIIGKLIMFDYEFDSNEMRPLKFKITKDGYVYLGGKGTVRDLKTGNGYELD